MRRKASHVEKATPALPRGGHACEPAAKKVKRPTELNLTGTQGEPGETKTCEKKKKRGKAKFETKAQTRHEKKVNRIQYAAKEGPEKNQSANV